jgi:predicted ATP-grasp superfamily ATP-dependent carboligase
MGKISILVLEGGYKLTSTLLFCIAQSKDFDIHFLSRTEKSPFRYSRYVKSHHYFPAEKPVMEFIGFAERVTKKTNSKVLLPIDAEGMHFIIEYKKEFSAFINPALTAHLGDYDTAADKGKLAEFLIRENIPCPPTIVNLQENLEEQLDNFKFPVLLKPTDGEGGKRITFHDTKEDVLKFIRENNIGEKYIIQTLINGYDIDCNVLYKEGKLQYYSIQKGVSTGENGYKPATAIEFVKDERVIEVVDKMMSKLNWSGVAHIDLRFDEDEQKMKIIEINTRFWLTIIGSILVTKINFAELIVKLTLGLPTPTQNGYPTGRYIAFVDYLEAKFSKNTTTKFRFKETTAKYVLGDLGPKLYLMASNEAVRKWTVKNLFGSKNKGQSLKTSVSLMIY